MPFSRERWGIAWTMNLACGILKVSVMLKVQNVYKVCSFNAVIANVPHHVTAVPFRVIILSDLIVPVVVTFADSPVLIDDDV